MRPEFEKYSLIDNYLGGKLSAQENAAFEKEMAEDSALREDVFDRKVVNEIIIEKRFFDIAAGLRNAPSSTGSLISKSVKRFVGIGAAVSVILFTPYYFSRKTEQVVEHTSNPELKSETAEKNRAEVRQQTEEAPVALLEEQVQETPAATSTEVSPEEVIPTKKTTETKAAVPQKTATKNKAKSYILEIPIDDPSAKGHGTNAYVFSLSKAQSWQIPMKNHASATITIFNKQGDEVFSSTLEKNKNTRWKGLSNDGIKQKAGKYAYLLDFGNGDIEHGHVTINP